MGPEYGLCRGELYLAAVPLALALACVESRVVRMSSQNE